VLLFVCVYVKNPFLIATHHQPLSCIIAGYIPTVTVRVHGAAKKLCVPGYS